MGTNKKPEVSKEEIEAAKTTWIGFTELSKYAIIAIFASLALLGFILL
jgi:hypothetical protein